MKRFLALAAVALFAGWSPAEVPAETKNLVIVTSFPKELFEAYGNLFEKKYPGVKVTVRQGGTSSRIRYIRETAARPDSDIFWASAVDAHEVLKGEGLLQRYQLPGEIARRIPRTVAGYPIHDPEGYYFGFAVTGYGLMWNTRYLAARKLPAPAEWTDLQRPEYSGHLVVSAPSRSGTTHMTIEAILQAYGWEKGWGVLLNSGGNMGAITERSFGVPEAVNAGQYGIGLVVDFFGLSAKASGYPIEFRYPTLTSITPAGVSIIKGAPNLENARRFVDLLLGDEGQLLLFSPRIGRMPVVPELYGKAPPGWPNPFTMKLAELKFDLKKSQDRYFLINSLYDQVITFRLPDLRAAWRAIYAAEAALEKAKAAGRPAGEAEGLIAQARALASRAPLSEAEAGKREVQRAFRAVRVVKGKREAVPAQMAKYETAWDTFAKGNYGKARELAERASALLR